MFWAWDDALIWDMFDEKADILLKLLAVPNARRSDAKTDIFILFYFNSLSYQVVYLF